VSAERRHAFSGAPLEEPYGYSRAVRVGERIVVSGCAPIWPDDFVDSDPGVQARRCLEVIAKALDELGGSMADVVRTRMFVTDAAFADAVGEAHGEAFRDARPATSMLVVAGLLDPRWKVEIEAEAIVKGSDPMTRGDSRGLTP
jgi:enamine deaminase RidA (YjgF/YER057c/UK114 family)